MQGTQAVVIALHALGITVILLATVGYVQSADSSAQLTTGYNSQTIRCTGETTSISVLKKGLLYTGGSSVRSNLGLPTICATVNIQATDTVIVAEGRSNTTCKGLTPLPEHTSCIWDQSLDSTYYYGPVPGPTLDTSTPIAVGANCLTIYNTEHGYNPWVMRVEFIKPEDDGETVVVFATQSVVGFLHPVDSPRTWVLDLAYGQSNWAGVSTIPESASCTATGLAEFECSLLPRVLNPDYGKGGDQDKYTYDLLGNYVYFAQHTNGKDAVGNFELHVYSKPDCLGNAIWSSDGSTGSEVFALPENCVDCSFQILSNS